jgi:hypothetical protein
LSEYSRLKYDNDLLGEGLISQSLGINEFSATDFIYSSGISLHAMNYDIHSIQYKIVVPEESGCKRFFKTNHQKISLEGNRMIPPWINIVLVNDVF